MDGLTDRISIRHPGDLAAGAGRQEGCSGVLQVGIGQQDEAGEAVLGRQAADQGVLVGGALGQLTQAAEDKHAATLATDRAQRGLNGDGVGAVGVVDDRHAVGGAPDLHGSGRRCERK